MRRASRETDAGAPARRRQRARRGGGGADRSRPKKKKRLCRVLARARHRARECALDLRARLVAEAVSELLALVDEPPQREDLGDADRRRVRLGRDRRLERGRRRGELRPFFFCSCFFRVDRAAVGPVAFGGAVVADPDVDAADGAAAEERAEQVGQLLLLPAAAAPRARRALEAACRAHDPRPVVRHAELGARAARVLLFVDTRAAQ